MVGIAPPISGAMLAMASATLAAGFGLNLGIEKRLPDRPARPASRKKPATACEAARKRKRQLQRKARKATRQAHRKGLTYRQRLFSRGRP